MSDFLGRLLARTRDEADVIRPRLPGRFEPVRAEGRLDVVESVTAPTQNTPQPRPATRQPPLPERLVEDRRPVHRGRLTKEPRSTEQKPADPPIATPRPTHSDRGEARRVTQVREPAGQRDPDTRGKPGPHAPAPAPHVIPARSLVTPADPVRARDGIDVPPAPEKPPRTPRAAVHPHAEHRNDESPAVRPRLPEQETRDADGEPVIRIHIGRIDVRAIHDAPPAPTRPSRPEPKRLTLEEYARERGRGER